MTLTEFLLARIAEDEAAARDRREWVTEQMGRVSDAQQHPGPVGVALSSWDVGPGDPARVLAECEAKRRIVEAHRVQVEDDDQSAWIVASNVLLKALALPYADHPDYRAEWRP